MLWPDRFRLPRVFLSGIALAASLALAGCLRPLYGPTASGASMQEELAAIEIPEIPERLGHYLRTELIFLLDGSGQKSAKRYVLTIAPTTNLLSAIVDSLSARADVATLNGTAAFQLKTADGARVVYQGSAIGSATYDRSAQRFATVRAARDAEIRLAKLLAEQIKNRIAAALASRTS